MRTRATILGVCIAVAVSALAAAAPSPAAVPARPGETGAMRAAITRFVAPVAPEYLEGMSVRRTVVSTRDPRFAAVVLDMPYAGRQTAYLRRGAGGWRVLDIGPARVGCGIVPPAALADLGGRCPA